MGPAGREAGTGHGWGLHSMETSCISRNMRLISRCTYDPWPLQCGQIGFTPPMGYISLDGAQRMVLHSPYHWSRPLPGLTARAAWRIGFGVEARFGGENFFGACFGAAFFTALAAFCTGFAGGLGAAFLICSCMLWHMSNKCSG